jgi:aminoglycoside 3-N-acetyltransferase
MIGIKLRIIASSPVKRTVRSAMKRIRKDVINTLYRWIGAKFTKYSLANDFTALGIRKGDIIFVHSSLSKIGYVEGGADTVIDALLLAVGETGTVLMPCFTIHGSMKNTLESGFVFDPRNSKVTTGTIPETFRKRSGVYRSLHPTHSVCAYGRFADRIVEGHELSGTNFGEGTPFHKFMQLGGKILGLGIDLGPVTFYHVLEDVKNDFPRRVYCRNSYSVKLLDRDGKTLDMRVRVHDPKISRTRIDRVENSWIRNFFTEYLRARKFLVEGWVGRAHSWIIRAKDMYDAQLELVRRGVTIYTTRKEYEKITKNREHKSFEFA